MTELEPSKSATELKHMKIIQTKMDPSHTNTNNIDQVMSIKQPN